ncbi:hypothetical protein HMPREF9141_0250 [Prevotella multiformis DSM 16608]|uniref:Uncharacterized protein n=1 Tax=Prevotella multiformis DSM 16608 TaxID=888743 RepID=F0F3T4_9BACT|nr:hypothetical protein HMPREF9141_0250 [Prevotella multiformis DSM 16608]
MEPHDPEHETVREHGSRPSGTGFPSVGNTIPNRLGTGFPPAGERMSGGCEYRDRRPVKKKTAKHHIILQ